ncbi:MAG: septum formation initiator family protein [Pseudomonadota bacterium]
MARTQETAIRAGTAIARAIGISGLQPGIRRAAPLTVVILSVAVLFVGLFYVRTRMQIVQIGYEISGLETKNKELKNRKRELELEIASLQSPGELERKARKIGLVFPEMQRVVHVP